MNPALAPGDLVAKRSFYRSQQPGVVVSVTPANDVPDAAVRGLLGVQPWSFWVFFPGPGLCGPFRAWELCRVT